MERKERRRSINSIDDYPEHLNPFYEDEQKELTVRKLKQGTSSTSLNRSNSFSGFFKVLRSSFRKKKINPVQKYPRNNQPFSNGLNSRTSLPQQSYVSNVSYANGRIKPTNELERTPQNPFENSNHTEHYCIATQNDAGAQPTDEVPPTPMPRKKKRRAPGPPKPEGDGDNVSLWSTTTYGDNEEEPHPVVTENSDTFGEELSDVRKQIENLMQDMNLEINCDDMTNDTIQLSSSGDPGPMK